MEIPLTEEWLERLYYVLINVYKNTDDPIRSGFPVVTDFSPAILNVCVNRPRTKVFGKTMYPHVLQRATVNIHSIINFHPFVDGNKRMALLSTYYYLLWNGYTFHIPYDADEYTIRIAKEHIGLNEILEWLKRNTSRWPENVLRHSACESELSKDGTVSASRVFLDRTLLAIFMPRTGLRFFRDKILEQHRKRLAMKYNGKS
jgi:death-on-curing protein